MADVTVLNAVKIGNKLRVWAKKLRDPVRAGDLAYEAGETLRAHMVENYLTGQRLKVRSGKLRSSFSTSILLDDRTTAVMGSPTVYARVHEYGLNDPAQKVKSYYRRRGIVRKPKESYRSWRKRKVAEEKSDPTILVKAHTRRAYQRERKYMRDTLKRASAKAIRRARLLFKEMLEENA